MPAGCSRPRLVLLGEDSGAHLAALLAAEGPAGVVGSILIGGYYDLSRVAGRAPPDGAAMDAGEGGEGGQIDGAAPDGNTPPPQDTGAPDINVPPPDTGAPADTGTE